MRGRRKGRVNIKGEGEMVRGRERKERGKGVRGRDDGWRERGRERVEGER